MSITPITFPPSCPFTPYHFCPTPSMQKTAYSFCATPMTQKLITILCTDLSAHKPHSAPPTKNSILICITAMIHNSPLPSRSLSLREKIRVHPSPSVVQRNSILFDKTSNKIRIHTILHYTPQVLSLSTKPHSTPPTKNSFLICITAMIHNSPLPSRSLSLRKKIRVHPSPSVVQRNSNLFDKTSNNITFDESPPRGEYTTITHKRGSTVVLNLGHGLKDVLRGISTGRVWSHNQDSPDGLNYDAGDFSPCHCWSYRSYNDPGG